MADSWTREFEEATRIAEDVEGRILAVPADGDAAGIRVASVARRKLAVLHNKIDRLESLLLQPPPRASNNEKELLSRRQSMVADLRNKAQQMSASLSSSKANRTSLMEGAGVALLSVQTSRTQDLDNGGLVSLQRQIMREQDEDLENLEHTVQSTRHIAIAVNEELELHTRLLDDMDQDTDVTNNKLLAAQRRLRFLNSSGQGWSCLTMLFLMVVVVVLILVLFKLL